MAKRDNVFGIGSDFSCVQAEHNNKFGRNIHISYLKYNSYIPSKRKYIFFSSSKCQQVINYFYLHDAISADFVSKRLPQSLIPKYILI